MRTDKALMSIVFMLCFTTGCSENKQAKTPTIPEFQEPTLQQGRSTWIQVCRNCHLMGVADAPAIDNYSAWESRLKKGKNVLYANAFNGIQGETGWTMPPKGGNESLSEIEVRHAVDFMLAAVEQIYSNSNQ